MNYKTHERHYTLMKHTRVNCSFNFSHLKVVENRVVCSFVFYI